MKAKGKVTAGKIKAYLKKGIGIASEVSGTVLAAKGHSPILGASMIAAKALDSYNRLIGATPESHFAGWDLLSLGTLKVSLIEALKDSGVLEILPSDRSEASSSAALCTVHGVEFGWVIRDPLHWSSGPWTREKDNSKASQALGRFFWEKYGTFLKIGVPRRPGVYIGTAAVSADPLTECLPSVTAETIYKRQKLFLDRGRSRSILLYGPPGTGKSYLMRYIAKLAGGFSLRLKGEDLLDVGSLTDILETLHPNVILIDDMDRYGSSKEVLTELEELRKPGVLIMISANDLTKFDAAMLRPGRFDEVVPINHLDEQVTEGLLAGVEPSIVDKLRGFPVAYLNQFRQDLEVLGQAGALRAMEELCSRYEVINEKIAKAKEVI